MLREGMDRATERAVLWHELVHAERGDAECLSEGEEASVDREAARWALPLDSVLAAVAVTCNYVTTAWVLEIDPDMLVLRLQTMHPSEKAAVRRVADVMQRSDVMQRAA